MRQRKQQTSDQQPATSTSLASSFQSEQTIADAFAHLPRQPKPRKKRGYSTEFKPRGDGQRYLLDRIPSTLWRDARAKAQREGVSMRALILSLLEVWSTPAKGDRP